MPLCPTCWEEESSQSAEIKVTGVAKTAKETIVLCQWYHGPGCRASQLQWEHGGRETCQGLQATVGKNGIG